MTVSQKERSIECFVDAAVDDEALRDEVSKKDINQVEGKGAHHAGRLQTLQMCTPAKITSIACPSEVAPHAWAFSTL